MNVKGYALLIAVLGIVLILLPALAFARLF